ncbi:MAG: hypothetical protein DSY47_02220 [Hydrogenothermus sp.]|nr:MAG: hypothetical protein DSY47_02220 [Hydrogenothermus sp.]
MGNKLLQSKIFSFLLIYIYICYIFYMYILIGKTFSSIEGYNYSIEIDYYSVFINGFLAFLPSIFLFSKPNQNKPSSIILLVLYLIHIIPSIIFPTFLKKFAIEFFWQLFISISFSIFVIIYFLLDKYKIRFPKIPYLKLLQKFYTIMLFLISIFIFTYLLYEFKGINYISIFHVYDVRNLYKETVNPLISYIVINSGYILSPFLILYSFTRKKLILKILFFTLGTLLSIIIFSNTGFKSVAFMWIFILIIYLYLKKIKIQYLPLKFLTFFIFFLFFLHILAIVLNLDFIYLHWIRRLLLSAGMNTTYFYDYIINHDLYFLKNAPLTISINYFGTYGSANTGLIGDGLTRYLFLGIYFNYLILFFILKILDSLYRYVTFSYRTMLLALTFPISYALSYSKTTSIFLTYGFLLIIFLFYWRIYVKKKNLSSFNCSSTV